MWKMLISRLMTVLLIGALPAPAFAQIYEGVMLPDRGYQASPPRPAAPTKDRDKDSLKNGAIIGAIVLGTWCLIVCGQGLDNPGQLPLAVAAGAGWGALIGAGIDASFSRRPGVSFRWRF